MADFKAQWNDDNVRLLWAPTEQQQLPHAEMTRLGVCKLR